MVGLLLDACILLYLWWDVEKVGVGAARAPKGYIVQRRHPVVAKEIALLTNLIPDQDQQRIRRFVDIFLPRCVSIAVVVPESMRAGEPREDGWIPWKAVDCPIGDEEILTLEKEIGVSLPPLFRAYLMYQCLLMTDFVVRLPETPYDDPLGALKHQLTPWKTESFFQERRLLPFGYDSNDAGPVCFDVAKPTAEGDYPVVVVDHERTEDPAYSGRVIAASFGALLDEIEAELLSYDES